MNLKVGDKVVCEKFYFAMNSKGVAYYYKNHLYEITYSNPIGINIKDDKGLELWFGFTGHCAVGLDKFVYHGKDNWSSYSRICVSVQHELFKKFIKNII